jgi:NAD(P)-dependent dehydrogenase (short-subunit alcohol dehydrogenase family)
MEDMNIEGLAAIVTGGASGLGGATAERLAQAGAMVTIFDLNAELGAAHAKQIGGRFAAVDVTDEVVVEQAISEAEGLYGKARILVNCAGVGPLGFCHHYADLRAVGAGDESLATIDNPVVAFENGGRAHHRWIGASAIFRGRFCHEEGRADVSSDQRFEKSLLDLGASDPAQQKHIALVRRCGVDRHRT